MGQASISWGHGVGDGVYACNNWVSDCRTSQGGCLVTGAPHWNDGKPWDCHPLKSTWGDGCSVPDWLDVFPNAKEGLRLACDQHDYCYYGPIKNGFWDTYRHCTKLFFSEVLTNIGTLMTQCIRLAILGKMLWLSIHYGKLALLCFSLGLEMVFRTSNSHPMRNATWVKANPRDISGHRVRVRVFVFPEHHVTIAALVTVAGLARNHGGNEQCSLSNTIHSCICGNHKRPLICRSDFVCCDNQYYLSRER